MRSLMRLITPRAAEPRPPAPCPPAALDAGAPRRFAYPAVPGSAGAAKTDISSALGGCPVAAAAVMCAGRLAEHAIRHYSPGQPGGTFEVALTVHPGARVAIEVSGQGTTQDADTAETLRLLVDLVLGLGASLWGSAGDGTVSYGADLPWDLPQPREGEAI